MLRPWMQVAFKQAIETAEQTAYNNSMTGVRTAVKWSCKEVKQSSPSQDFSRSS